MNVPSQYRITKGEVNAAAVKEGLVRMNEQGHWQRGTDSSERERLRRKQIDKEGV